jgi:hypothetical protein
MEDHEEDEDWEQELISCAACQKSLLLFEHSPFNDGYYLYSTKCPKRVDVSIYDTGYELAEKICATANPGIADDSHEFLILTLEEIARRLHPCTCSGRFAHNANRRCLYCGAEIEGCKDYMNVWLPSFLEGGDEVPGDESKFIIEPKWRAEQDAAMKNQRKSE